MTQVEAKRDGGVRDTLRRVFRLLELNDFTTARWTIAAAADSGDLTPSLRLTLEGLSEYAGGNLPLAAARLQAAVERDPSNSCARYWLAAHHSAEGRVAAAMSEIQWALKADPEMGEAWFLNGGLAFRQNDFNGGMHSLLRAIQCDVDNGRYWHTLNQWLTRMQINGPMLEARALLIEALKRGNVDLSVLDQVLYATLDATPGVKQLVAMAEAGTPGAQIEWGEVLPLLNDELFLVVLQHSTLQHAGYERMLTGLRRSLLGSIAGPHPFPRDRVLRAASALAVYALTTEFVFYQTPVEAAELAACRQRLCDAATDSDWLPVLAAIVACYEPLAGLPDTVLARVVASPANSGAEFAALVGCHILEPWTIRDCGAGVETFASISNSVSLAVQQQYEENPYPRWRVLGQPQATTFDNRTLRCLPYLRVDQRPRLQALPDQPLDVLVAGCGTGRHALWCSREYPSTRILAVDLSRASLAYARMKAAQLGITGIDFRQGDLLELPALGLQFDLIECIGVLHHMEDPASGLAALARCLRPAGWMKIALYSHAAREAVRHARERIADLGYPATADGIRQFRHELMRNDSDPLYQSCAKFRDFYSLSECRDLLFHVQEHQFTTAGLERLVASAGLEFMGFEADLGFVQRSTPSVTDWQSLRQWGEFEDVHRDFFGNMYYLWLRRPAATQ